jgi:SAM-dependent methyltransferase
MLQRIWNAMIGAHARSMHRILPELVPALSAGKSLPRAFMERKLRDVRLTGRILDLGGGGSSAAKYATTANGARVLSLDVRVAGRPDLVADLEQGLPLRNASVDVVLLLNVIEHIYHYEMVLAEIGRVISPSGMLYLFVPFLYARHTARYDEFTVEDYFRYGPVTLHRLLTGIGGFRDIDIEPCAYGPSLAAADVMATGISRQWLRVAVYSIGVLVDRLFFVGKQGAGPAITEWPVGYWVCARKTGAAARAFDAEVH